MKHSPKGPMSEALKKWLGRKNLKKEPEYKNFRGEPNAKTRQDLLQEQGHVCAYCGRGISETDDSHIEHFFPQSLCRGRTLDWENMFASCGRPGMKNVPRTCGDAKGNWFEDGFEELIPSNPKCERRFRYESTGEVRSRRSDDTIVQNTIRELKLNEQTLEAQRQIVISSIHAMVGFRDLNPESLREQIRIARSANMQGRQKTFGHVAALYLEDLLETLG